MEKVMIAKEEAVALESALEISGGDKAHIVEWHSKDLWTDKQAELNDMDLNTLCTALYVGYEIEPGPEEKILNHFNGVRGDNYGIGFREGIKVALANFNIQIQGINC